MKAKYIIGGIIIVLFVVWGASAFFKTTIQYVPIEQAIKSKKTVQVLGKIDFDKVNYSVKDSRLEFAVYDSEAKDKSHAEHMNVVYYGVVPGNFDQATSVVLKGKNEGGHFVASQILVKCPSKYQGENGNNYQDVKKHNEAVGTSGV